MKIGIMTFYRAHNYGAALQAYALQRYLQSGGYNASTIDFIACRNCATENLYKKNSSLQNLLFNILTLANMKKQKSKYLAFERFVNENIMLSPVKYNESNFDSVCISYDAIISGSDQVFNPQMREFSMNFLLDYEKKDKKKIAYAPSFGNSQLDRRFKKKIGSLLQDFDYLSARETDGIRIIEEITTNKTVTQVLDPVFLLTGDEWRSISVQPKCKEKYILAYCVENSDAFYEGLKKLKAQSNIKIYTIRRGFRQTPYVDCEFNGVGPLEFLGIIQNASAIYTNSFHGTALSILLKKDFIAIPHSIYNSRINSLLHILELTSQLLEYVGDYTGGFLDDMKYDKNKTECLLKEQISNSKAFLKRSLIENK